MQKGRATFIQPVSVASQAILDRAYVRLQTLNSSDPTAVMKRAIDSHNKLRKPSLSAHLAVVDGQPMVSPAHVLFMANSWLSLHNLSDYTS